MKKRDWILIAVLLAAAAVGLLIVHHMQSGSGSTVTVTVDGEVYGTYDLDEDQTITIDNDYGHNVIEISGGSVSMTEADCPDLICVHRAKISKDNETIICLPHKLVVEVDSSETADADATLR